MLLGSRSEPGAALLQLHLPGQSSAMCELTPFTKVDFAFLESETSLLLAVSCSLDADRSLDTRITEPHLL